MNIKKLMFAKYILPSVANNFTSQHISNLLKLLL